MLVGVGYWDQKMPTVHGPDAVASARALSEEPLIVPNFFWKVVCDPIKTKVSFAVIAENDLEDDHGNGGYPSSLFKRYSAAQVEKFFGLKLNLPDDCKPKETNVFALEDDWQGKTEPATPTPERPGALQLRLDTQNLFLTFGERATLHFRMPFGHVADDATQLRVLAPSLWWANRFG